MGYSQSARWDGWQSKEWLAEEDTRKKEQRNKRKTRGRKKISAERGRQKKEGEDIFQV